ncbi:PorT family protein [Chitinophaga horti]|uniref:PorT family protein n=1 Tax=Chitinophaga horti TaxID=2920382 RepID=A0ABY6J4W7_9BACT|nr:porin family protein [Chitinophaga horti]UYQ93219.1 PorT family protein [Chitinophaga horti]
MVKILHNIVSGKQNYWKCLMFAGVIMGASVSAQAQEGFSKRMSRKMERKVRFGFKLDPGVAVMKSQDNGIERNSGKFHLNYGIMADFFLDKEERYAVGTGFQVTHTGSVLQYDQGIGLNEYNDYPTEYDLRLQYLEVPLTLKLKAATRDDIGIWGQFGTYFAAPIRARANVISNQKEFRKENVLNEMHRLNMGLLLAAGVEYPLTETLSGIVGFGYQGGFTDLTRNKKWNDGKVNLNSFSLRLGLYF